MTNLPDPATQSELPDLRTVPHTFVEDIYGVSNGCLLLALGVHLLHQARLITGGVAGLALMLSYLVPFSPGVLFTAINLPIFLVFWRMLGTPYIVRTTIATLSIMVLVDMVGAGIVISSITMPIAALVGGTVMGIGVLAVTRHATGVGGLAVVARWLHRQRGWNFGAICMAFDAVIVGSAFAVLGVERGFWSLVCALATNAVVLIWHRPDRYLVEG
jgi:uncharacterized membrane-anchored protein YitT (DUF2179 family)